MLLVLFLLFLAVYHLSFFRKKALWNTFGERLTWALATPMLLIGVMHLVLPEEFESLIPSWLPDWMPGQDSLIFGGGVALIGGSLALLVKKIRRTASFGVIGMLASFLPANLEMAQNGFELSNGDPLLEAGSILGWSQIPLQFVYMGIAWFVGRK